MYIIKKDDVLKFKALAAQIKTEDRLPVLQYVLFSFSESGYTILKNSMKNFLLYQADGDTKNAEHLRLLVEEKTLYNFCDNAPTDDIELIEPSTADETAILLRCINWEVTSSTMPAGHYPVIPEIPAGGVILNNEVLKQIGTAANFVLDEELPTPRSHVFVGKNYVAGSDASIAYFSPLTGDFTTELTLRQEVAAAISTMNGAEYLRSGNYDIFKGLNCSYGFIMPDIKFRDITSLVAEPAVLFTAQRDDLLRFCNACMSLASVKIKIAVMTKKGSGVLLSMHETETNKKVENAVPSFGAPVGQFKFLVNDMLRLLKAIPDETVKFAPGKQRYYINGAGYNSLMLALE